MDNSMEKHVAWVMQKQAAAAMRVASSSDIFILEQLKQECCISILIAHLHKMMNLQPVLVFSILSLWSEVLSLPSVFHQDYIIWKVTCTLIVFKVYLGEKN